MRYSVQINGAIVSDAGETLLYNSSVAAVSDDIVWDAICNGSSVIVTDERDGIVYESKTDSTGGITLSPR